MERAPTLLSIAWIPALLVLAGLWALALEGGRRRATNPWIDLRLPIGAAVLALLIAASLIDALRPARPLLVERVGTWLEIGYGLALRGDLVFDPFAAAVIVVGVGVGLGVMLAALARPRGLSRVSLALGGLVLCAVGESLVVVAAGWHLGGWALLAGDDPPRGRRGAALAIGDLGLWIALAALYAGTGALGVAQVARGAVLGANSGLILGEVGGASLATIAALGLALAGVGRALATPEGGARGLLGVLGGPALLLAMTPLLVRLAPVLTLSPATPALVAGLGLALAAGGAAQALTGAAPGRAEDEGATAEVLRVMPGRVVAGLGRITAGLVLVAAAMGAWGAVLALALVASAVQATRALAGPRGRWALGLAELAMFAALGVTAAGLAAGRWPIAAALPIAAAGVIGAAQGRRWGPAEADRGAREIAPAGSPRGDVERLDALLPVFALALAAAGAALCLVPVAGPSAVERWVAPAVVPVTLAPLAAGSVAAMAGLAAAVGGLGWLLGRRRAPLPETAGGASATLPPGGRLRRTLGAPAAAALGLAELADHLRGRLALRLWFADAFPRPATLLGLCAGLLLTLGAVYCNPEVLRIGPSRVHPVDLGGLDPFIVAPRRSGRDKGRMNATDFAAAAAAAAAADAAARVEAAEVPR